jgi:hypothetical protein
MNAGSNNNKVDIEAPVSPVEDDDGSSSIPSTAAVVVQDQNIRPDYLVSEHEDNDGGGNHRELSRMISSGSRGQSQIFAAGGDDENTTVINVSRPAEIPPEADDVAGGETNDRNEAESDDDSEYSYDYDDDDDGHFSGFLISTEPTHNTNTNNTIHNDSVAAVVPQEDPPQGEKNVVEDDEAKISQFATLDRTESSEGSDRKKKWVKPTQAAVSMSLRAESEKSGGRRRLAADLFKVMMTNTREAGFKVEQKDDECMDKWTVKLFKFDEDSDLHKDLLVLGIDHVELEMNFPEQVGAFGLKKSLTCTPDENIFLSSFHTDANESTLFSSSTVPVRATICPRCKPSIQTANRFRNERCIMHGIAHK